MSNYTLFLFKKNTTCDLHQYVSRKGNFFLMWFSDKFNHAGLSDRVVASYLLWGNHLECDYSFTGFGQELFKESEIMVCKET